MNNQEENFFLYLKFIPQVILLSANLGSNNSFQPAINFFLKRIICQKKFCQNNQLCYNCQKLINNHYFDLIKLQFNQSNSMKKQDVVNIINNLSLQSLEGQNPKICLLEAIEYSSLEASNTFLKFLENVPKNTFLILTTNDIEKLLPTIKSRCQIFNLSQTNPFKDNFLNLDNEHQQLILNLITKFINYDNEKRFIENFFLIKKMTELKENLLLFFQFLLELTTTKIAQLNNLSKPSPQLVNKIIINWKNEDQFFLKKLVGILIEVINKLNNVKNINLSLLANYFFIAIYQEFIKD
ncbi:MAG: hypothetical protein REH79_01920 [Spiroplasma sp.]|nr:hypothetical protein [Spiroplasma sp.]